MIERQALATVWFQLQPKNDTCFQICFHNEFSKLSSSTTGAHSTRISWLSSLTQDSAQRAEQSDLVCTEQKAKKILSIHTKNVFATEALKSLNYEHPGDHSQPAVVAVVHNHSVVKQFCSRIMVYTQTTTLLHIWFQVQKQINYYRISFLAGRNITMLLHHRSPRKDARASFTFKNHTFVLSQFPFLPYCIFLWKIKWSLNQKQYTIYNISDTACKFWCCYFAFHLKYLNAYS